MVKYIKVVGWTCCNPDNGVYFMRENPGIVCWTNSYVEAKKWDTKEEVVEFINKCDRSNNLYRGLDLCKPVKVEYEGYYGD